MDPRGILPPFAAAAASALDEALKPWKEQNATRVSALLASARGWLAAANTDRALGVVSADKTSTAG